MIEPIAGKTYIIKLTDGQRVPATFKYANKAYRGLGTFLSGKSHRTHYHFVNLRTGRDIVLKSRQKIKAVVE